MLRPFTLLKEKPFSKNHFLPFYSMTVSVASHELQFKIILTFRAYAVLEFQLSSDWLPVISRRFWTWGGWSFWAWDDHIVNSCWLFTDPEVAFGSWELLEQWPHHMKFWSCLIRVSSVALYNRKESLGSLQCYIKNGVLQIIYVNTLRKTLFFSGTTFPSACSCGWVGGSATSQGLGKPFPEEWMVFLAHMRAHGCICSCGPDTHSSTLGFHYWRAFQQHLEVDFPALDSAEWCSGKSSC